MKKYIADSDVYKKVTVIMTLLFIVISVWTTNIMSSTHFLMLKTALVLFAILITSLGLFKNYISSDVAFIILNILSITYVFSDYIIGKKYYMYYDVGADTHDQYYSYYISIINQIKEYGLIKWNWSYGLGVSLITNNQWIMDPFAIVLICCGLLFGAGALHYLLVWMQIIKIIVLFYLSKKFLKYHFENDILVNSASFFVAHCGYIYLWGQHYFLGTALFYYVLLLLLLERALFFKFRKGKILLTLALAWMLAYGVYTGYMILLGLLIYFVYRQIWICNDGKENFFRYLFQSAFIVIDAILISGLRFLPILYNLLTNSSRISYDSNIFLRILETFSTYTIKEIPERIAGIISNNILFVNDASRTLFCNYYENPKYFINYFFICSLCLWFVFSKKTENKSIIAEILKKVFFVILLFSSFAGLVFNGFQYPAYRHSFILVPFMGLIYGKTIEDYNSSDFTVRKKIFAYVLSIIFTMIGVVYAWQVKASEVAPYLLVVTLIIAFFFILWGLHFFVFKRFILAFGLSILIFSNVLDNEWSTNRRAVTKNEDYKLVWDKGALDIDTSKALNWLRNYDNTFYRIEKTYNDWSYFTPNDSLVENYSSGSVYCSVLNRNIQKFYELIYINSNIDSSIKFFSLSNTRDRIANKIIDVKYILSKEPMVDSQFELINQIDDIYIYRNTDTDSVAKWYGSTITTNEFESLDEETQNQVLDKFMVTDDVYMNAHANGTMQSDFYIDKKGELKGTIKTDNDGLVMIAVPVDDGWSVYVDNQKVETFLADYGFIGLPIDSGNHEVSIKYETPMFKQGLFMSCIGILLLLMSMSYTKMRFADI
ncbi:membrane protein YfhO [Pseudobutyrivibrio sp. ACV-2]|uniref:YfhO family protein n=1 Tax=Pseudobutyrivibrio sp. ACV-2 TaxID=1520801 RepID=UPI000896D190|nr:YfhO family protein [Pseudobutyrivibrio sp. ACV-2]SEB00506.1 membrane protein YfhO [Pseudobutyrivibrio sp. ACV-2]